MSVATGVAMNSHTASCPWSMPARRGTWAQPKTGRGWAGPSRFPATTALRRYTAAALSSSGGAPRPR
uniref:Uncharacterized protein n=1 Tax=Human herpesvirus 2 TaxID=10310 RepID=A0A481TWW1_HHV2|nr:hypothetical protein [Human alphaherpesvirus 2]QBH85132.1 hypothetical protein [Human alphaherpesvirus 2]